MENLPATNQAITVNTGTTPASSEVDVQNLKVIRLTPNQCVQVSTGGLLSTSGSQCGTGSGVSVSSNTFPTLVNGTIISSPTISQNFTTDFSGSLSGSTTTITLDTTIGHGQHFIIANPASQQSNTTLNVTTGTFQSAILGSPSATNLIPFKYNSGYMTINSSGTAQALAINVNGKPSGGSQNQAGAVTIRSDVNGDTGLSPTLLVLVDSSTDATDGNGLLEIWELNPNHNSYLLWIHGASPRNSDEPVRFDGPTFGIDEVSTSTDAAHGLGKWKVISEALASPDLQIASPRSWDNATFEHLLIVHGFTAGALDGRQAGLYFEPSSLDNDSAVLTSSDTSGITFATLNSHEISLTGPLNVVSGSWKFRLPATSNSAGQVMYQAATDSTGARPFAFTTGGSAGQCLQFNGTSPPTWGSCASGSASILNQNTLQSGATFYVSSGTVQNLTVSGGGAAFYSPFTMAQTETITYGNTLQFQTSAGATGVQISNPLGLGLKSLTFSNMNGGIGFGTNPTQNGLFTLEISSASGSGVGSFALMTSSADASVAYAGFVAPKPMQANMRWQLPDRDSVGTLPLSSNGSQVLSWANTFSSMTIAGITSTVHINNRASAPSLSSCGAGATIVGTDVSGTITEGTGSPTGCTVTFQNSWANTPFCVAQTTSTVTTAAVTSASGSQFVITTSASIPSDTINYICIGRD